MKMNSFLIGLTLSLIGFGRAQRGQYFSPHECIARAPDPHTCDIHSPIVEHGSSTLHAAVFRGDPSLVERILEGDVNPNDEHHVSGTNLLIAACEKERFRTLWSKISRVRIKYGSKWRTATDIDNKIIPHLRQLDRLSSDKATGQLQKVKDVQKGQMVSMVSEVANHHSQDLLKVPKMLLAANMDVDGVDQLGRTALFEAVESFSLPLVSLLLEHGANATHVDYEGTTPMMLARRSNLRAIIAKLVAHGADAPGGDMMHPTKSPKVAATGLTLENLAERMHGHCDFDILDSPKWADFKNQYIRGVGGVPKPALIRNGFTDRPKPLMRKTKRRRGRRKKKKKKSKDLQTNDDNQKWTVPAAWTKRRLSTFKLSSRPVEVGSIPYATLTANGYFQTEMPLKDFLHRHLHPDNQKKIEEDEVAVSPVEEQVSAVVDGNGQVTTTDSGVAIKTYFVCVRRGGASYHYEARAGYLKRGERVKQDECVSGTLTAGGDWIQVSSKNPNHHGTYLPLRTSKGEVFRRIPKREAQLSYVFDPEILKIPAAAPLMNSLHSRRPYVSDRDLQHAVTNTQLAIGPKGSGAPRHVHDGAFSVLVSGMKFWAIWPPGDAKYSNVRTFDDWQKHFQEPAEGETRPFLCVQQTGDTVYIPAFWAHSTMVVSDVGYAVGDSFSGSTLGYMSRR